MEIMVASVVFCWLYVVRKLESQRAWWTSTAVIATCGDGFQWQGKSTAAGKAFHGGSSCSDSDVLICNNNGTAAATIAPGGGGIEPQLLSEKNVMIAAHGNSLRSIILYVDNLTSQEIVFALIGAFA
ncbi:hypothetical protein HN51_048122 [Arachis hypogaea]